MCVCLIALWLSEFEFLHLHQQWSQVSICTWSLIVWLFMSCLQMLSTVPAMISGVCTWMAVCLRPRSVTVNMTVWTPVMRWGVIYPHPRPQEPLLQVITLVLNTLLTTNCTIFHVTGFYFLLTLAVSFGPQEFDHK